MSAKCIPMILALCLSACARDEPKPSRPIDYIPVRTEADAETVSRSFAARHSQGFLPEHFDSVCSRSGRRRWTCEVFHDTFYEGRVIVRNVRGKTEVSAWR